MNRLELEQAMRDGTWLVWGCGSQHTPLHLVKVVPHSVRHLSCTVTGGPSGWEYDALHLFLRLATPQDMLELE